MSILNRIDLYLIKNKVSGLRSTASNVSHCFMVMTFPIHCEPFKTTVYYTKQAAFFLPGLTLPYDGRWILTACPLSAER